MATATKHIQSVKTRCTQRALRAHRWVKPVGKLSACSPTDDEYKVVGVSTQALHHLEHLCIGFVVNGILVHKGAIIVQQQQSLAGSAA